MIGRNYIINEFIKTINRKEVKDEVTLTNFFENLFPKEGKYFRDSVEEDFYTFLSKIYINNRHFFTFLDKVDFHSGV